MGRYDIPASIDYVLNVTGQEKLAAYFGYSLGCSAFFMGAIQHPRLNEQTEIMIALGPTVSVAHLDNFFRFLAPFVKWYQVRTGYCSVAVFTGRVQQWEKIYRNIVLFTLKCYKNSSSVSCLVPVKFTRIMV